MGAALPFLSFMHARLATALILMAVLLGLLGSYQFFRHHAVSPGFRSAYVILAGLTAVQSFAGLLQLAAGGRPHDLLHIVYGMFAVAFLPGVYFYVQRGDRTREAAFLAIACWVVLIAYFRGETTGQ